MATAPASLSSSSEDDTPLARRAGGKTAQAGNSNGASSPASGVKRGRAPGQQVKGTEKKRASIGQDVKPPNGASTPPQQSSAVKKEEAQNGKVGPTGVKKESPKIESTAGTSDAPVKKPRERKVYDLPGQKREPPPERDSLRIFYSTLRQQRPESEMALKWCIEHGLEPEEVASAWVEKNGKTKAVSVSLGRGRGRGAGQSPGRVAGEKIEAPAPSGRRRVSKKRSAEGALPPKEITKMSKGRKPLKLEGATSMGKRKREGGIDCRGNPAMDASQGGQNEGPKEI